jgi:phosphoribosylformylglycinamidine synthase
MKKMMLTFNIFQGEMIVDGEVHPKSLIDLIMDTQKTSNQNNVIQFSDNSSAIKGFNVRNMVPSAVIEASPFTIKSSGKHIIFTAETHNFPTGVAPFRFRKAAKLNTKESSCIHE